MNGVVVFGTTCTAGSVILFFEMACGKIFHVGRFL
jgi:hypothetical protein